MNVYKLNYLVQEASTVLSSMSSDTPSELSLTSPIVCILGNKAHSCTFLMLVLSSCRPLTEVKYDGMASVSHEALK